jgi:hypothetical protein
VADVVDGCLDGIKRHSVSLERTLEVLRPGLLRPRHLALST